jgi:hypothetical protein
MGLSGWAAVAAVGGGACAPSFSSLLGVGWLGPHSQLAWPIAEECALQGARDNALQGSDKPPSPQAWAGCGQAGPASVTAGTHQMRGHARQRIEPLPPSLQRR